MKQLVCIHNIYFKEAQQDPKPFKACLPKPAQHVVLELSELEAFLDRLERIYRQSCDHNWAVNDVPIDGKCPCCGDDVHEKIHGREGLTIG